MGGKLDVDVDVDVGLDPRLRLKRLGPRLVIAELMGTEEEELVLSTTVAEFAGREGDDVLETRELGVTEEEAKLSDVVAATTTSLAVVVAGAGLRSGVLEGSWVDGEERRLLTVAAHEQSSTIDDEI